ncbi:T9SS type A sorting domain-containing protein [Catalinimonas niigatensis]|uniref:hypothetical protein n=1 Tax=Catalinimonas niigatensis TaxID=1397264 RepID=UPI0026671AA5|nr:hypothetical protein [Catalinimonas niigatensis]WPP53218.1 hypothetical protein PZB72_12635 [Catalinimonas niigatensis]
MNKGLLSILLFIFSVSGLVLTPNTYAETKTYHLEKDDVDAVVYPNPAEEHIFVRLDLIDPFLNADSEIDLEIRNILGTPMPVESEPVDVNKLRIVTADYPSGYYLLIVRCKACGENSRSLKNVFKFLKN